jgi:hypothetical protein
VANYRRRKPALGWGGEKFTESAASALSGSWAGGSESGGDLPGPGALTFTVSGSGVLNAEGAALALWTDTFTNEARDNVYRKVISGLTPGGTFGWKSRMAVNVDTQPGVGSMRFDTIGVTTVTRTLPRGTGTTLFGPGEPILTDTFGSVLVPPSGEVILQVYARFNPSFFVNVDFFDLAYGTPGIGPRANLLVWGTPAGAGPVKTWPRRGGGSATSDRFPSGRRATRGKDDHDVLVMPMPFIPGEDVLRVGGPGGLDASGADGALGVRAALEYGRNGGLFTFYPDQDDLELEPIDCRLVAPMDGAYDRGDDSALRSVDWTLRTVTPGDVFPEY